MNGYIKSPINYIGNKYKLISQIIPLFPEKISTFVDVFGGSGTVLINTNAEHYIYNDVNPYVEGIFRGLIETDTQTIIDAIEKIIQEYSLSKTNKDGFERLRDFYNKEDNKEKDWLTLYTLMCHSFNHQFRFNTKHEYNSSFGKNRSYFSERQKIDLRQMKERMTTDIVTMSKSFKDIDYSDFDENDLLYFDPPYLNSVGNYNDGKRGFEGWNKNNERDLLDLLDSLNGKTRFALSNNLKYENDLLNKFKDKYKVYYLSGNYVNCNYHKLDRSRDKEVLITNYD